MKTKGFTKRMLTIVMMVLISVMMVFPAHAASKMKLNRTNMTLTVGERVNLKVTGTNSKAKWSSSNKAVAAVSSNGLVTAKKAGTATIKAVVMGKTYTCNVKAMNNIFTSTVNPKNVSVIGTGINLQVTQMQYSGNMLVVRGFFTNKTGKRVNALRNYNIKIYVTLANGSRVQLTDGTFNMNVNIPAGYPFGYQYTTLTFSGSALNPTVYNLRTARSCSADAIGTYRY